MNLSKLIQQQVGNAFTNVLGKGGLTEDITVRYITGDGTYDVTTDTHVPEFSDVPVKNVLVARPSFDDMEKHGALSADAKIIIPGGFIQTEPEADTDKVIRTDGTEWDIRKSVGVPGDGVYILYIYRT